MPRLRILTTREQETFDKPPSFDYQERKKFFSLPKKLLDMACTMRTQNSQIGFLLLSIYFRPTKRFFLPSDFYERDIEAATKLLGLMYSEFDSEAYTKSTRVRHQKLILEFYGFVLFDSHAEIILAAEIATMARIHLKPRLIFDRCIDFLIQKRIQLPKSGTLTELVRVGIQQRKTELIACMNANITEEVKLLLEELFAASDNKNRYRLTLLKKLSQSTQPAQIKECIGDYEILAALHEQLVNILSVLDLGHAGIRYYAGSVIKSRIFQLQQRSETDRYIHATAFVAHQFYRLRDNLIDMMLTVMASFQTTVARAHKERLFEQRKEQSKRLKTVIEDLDTSVFWLIQEIRGLTDDGTLSDEQKLNRIKSLLDKNKPENIERLKTDLESVKQDQSWYEILEEHSLRLQNRISPILKILNFESDGQIARLIDAIEHFKNKDGAITARAPQEFLDDSERRVLLRADGTFRTSLYKVFLFQNVIAAIKSGQLNVQYSYKYLPMDAYLINQERWNNEKLFLLKRADLGEFIESEGVLQRLANALDKQYQITNMHAAQNQHLKLRADGTFWISTPAMEATETDRLQELFPQRHDVPLAQVLETIDRHCNMLDTFQHWQQTHTKQSVSRPTLLAGIMGLGCGIGIRKMARISSRVTESELEYAVNWRFSIENIRAANDRVLAAMDKMELPDHYRREKGILHTASDGQKFEVRGDSLHASRSFKYFGQGQGISAYTFVDERNFLWHSTMISAADRESAYVIDGLMHNDVVKSDIHSTDTHGYTEAIFGLTHLLGFSFAPRIKGVGKQTLYIFKPKNREGQNWLIAPDKTVNDALIRENWDQLLRLIVTIKLKENTASDIFRRLNSYSRQHPLYQTLKAFGQIIKSLFILRYVDDIRLRQAIEKQLNKVELANRFTRAVAVGNPREFAQTEKEEQEIAEACNRLIRNSIICWNYLYLTRQLEKAADVETKENLLQMIAAHSPMSWAHINMLGEYDFSEEKLKDSVGILPLKNIA